ncbi:DUF3037 domain-containing protein [Halomonas sp. 7T]|uniref:DUF3037 domain-containing protein n=1 Tax=Halomonas sp. 7T TaxID=2893469 RepID=UPI0021DB09BA|nr:DUF3037 domain-containing protein [Halomonas sp. 7T]UXZ54795.1 DUF3037 domain-containing protein [Halomonas sp. 7T]
MDIYFNYSIIRFLPYRDIGEFINIGIVIHGNDGSFSTRVVDAGYSRVYDVFPALLKGLFAQHLKPLKRELSRIETLASNCKIDAQQQLFKNLIEPGEGVFTYSQAGTLVAKDPQAALDELFNRYIHHDFKHVASPEGK